MRSSTLCPVRRTIPEARSHPPDQAARSSRAVHRQGLSARLARQPVPRLFGRVQRAPQIHARRRPQGHRLADLRQDRQVLRQEVRGRDEHHGLHDDGPQPLDGLHLSAGVDEVRVLDLPGGRALLPDDPPAGPGGADHLRREDPQLPAAQGPPRPPGRRALAVGQPQARRRDRHRPQHRAGGGHAAACQPGDDLLRPAERSRRRCWRPSTACGTAGTT